MNKAVYLPHPDLAHWLPASLREIEHDQQAIPRIAKAAALVREIEAAMPGIPTRHEIEFDSGPFYSVLLVLVPMPPF
jgi:acetone carboxylase gamma subunit